MILVTASSHSHLKNNPSGPQNCLYKCPHLESTMHFWSLKCSLMLLLSPVLSSDGALQKSYGDHILHLPGFSDSTPSDHLPLLRDNKHISENAEEMEAQGRKVYEIFDVDPPKYQGLK